MSASTMIFSSPVPMPQNGRIVAVVGVAFYDDDIGVRELVVEDSEGERWHAYTNELIPRSFA